MPAGKAVQTYSILTIGDGLIAQIPALFDAAICAGIIVTRVTTGEGPSNVGRDIGQQVLAQPKALMIGGVIALGLAAIPGMPWPVFLALALAVGGIGALLARGTRRVVDEKSGQVTEVPAMQAAAGPAPKRKTGEPGEEFVPTVPLLMDVAAPLQQAFDVGGAEQRTARRRSVAICTSTWAFPASRCDSTTRCPTRPTTSCCPKCRCRRAVCARSTCWRARRRRTWKHSAFRS